MCALRRTFLTGESPQSALVVGRIQPKTRVSVVRRNLKEVGWQISGLTNRNHMRLQLRIRLPHKPKIRSGLGLRFVRELEQGKETV